MVWHKEEYLIAGISLLVIFVIITRKYEQPFRKKRLKLKRKEEKFFLGFKQYGGLFIIAFLIMLVIMFILKLTVLE